VRRVARRLGRLAGNTRLLTLIGVGSLAAGGADAAPAPILFKLTVVATVHSEWDHTGVPSPAGGCERIVRSEGFRDVRFRTAKPTLIRVANGRVLPATVRGLTGTVALAGANTVRDVCGTETKEAIQDCVTTRRSFRGATLGVLSTRAGSITLRPARRVRLRTVNCPQEPADVVRAPLGPVPGPLHVSTAALASKKTANITLTASASRRIDYAPVEQGTLQHRAVWKLTLSRVQP
jgi:hypothetical protein